MKEKGRSFKQDLLTCDDLISKDFDRVVIVLTRFLNETHDLDWSIKQWKFIITPVVYRLICLEHLYRRSGQEGIAKQISRPVVDFFDLSELIKNPKYCRPLKQQKQRTALGICKSILKKLLAFFSAQLGRRKPKYAFVDSYLTFFEQLEICLKNGVAYQDYDEMFNNAYEAVLSSSTNSFSTVGRNRLFRDLNNVCEPGLAEAISSLLPTIYFENFKLLKASASRIVSNKDFEIIFTGIGLHKNEVLKVLLALQDGTTPLITGQHGGEYGYCASSFFETHEINCSDYYISSGWSPTESCLERKIIRGPSIFIKSNKLSSGLNSNHSSIVLSPVDKVISQWHSSRVYPCEGEAYLRLVREVYVGLTQRNIRTKIRRHPREESGGYIDTIQTLSDSVPRNAFWDDSLSFDQVLCNSNLLVFTYFGTSFIQSLASNIPTILIWDDCIFPIRPEAEAAFNSMNLRLVFPTIADFLSMIEQETSVQAWWRDKAVQDCRKKFLSVYGLKTEDKVSSLSKIILDITENVN